MSTTKPVSALVDTKGNLTLDSGIAYVVNKLSQFTHRPTTDHWAAVKRLLRYLCGTLNHGIFLHKVNPVSLHAYTDANWAGSKDDYTSTSAYIVYLGRHPVS
nr:Retrovirus-related Pol polyprotein from transposon RE2 [Ipomoea trifida]